MNKAIFLDRDNTLIKDKGYTHKLEDLEFLPDTIEILKSLQKHYLLIIITNQSGIARGYYTEQDYFKFRDNMHSELKKQGVTITAEYYCPHHPNGTVEEYKKVCSCRKPRTGLFEQAKKDFDIDFSQSYMIGDKSSDIEAGEKIGAKTMNSLEEAVKLLKL